MRTKLSICLNKRQFGSERDALLSIKGTNFVLRAYRCDRCRRFHLTSRTKGKWVGLPAE